MRRSLVWGLLLVAGVAAAGVVRDIRRNDATGVPVLVGQSVTFDGVVTEVGHFGGWGPAFVQDSTGGVAVYGSGVSGLSIGDSVTVTGTVENFYGLAEVADPVVTSRGAVTVREPLVFEVEQVDDIDTAAGYIEQEGWLVRFDSVTIQHATGEVFQGNTNYTMQDPRGNTGAIRIDADASELVGLAIPDGWIALTGVIGQYKTSSPYFGGYQVMPRVAADVGGSAGQGGTIRDAIVDANGDGRPDRRGQRVTVTGVATVPDSLFDNRYLDIYIQDSTAGVNVFSFTLQNCAVGDSVSVSGTVDWYRGKTEISGASLTVLASGRSVQPRVLNCREASTEAHEGELVQVTGITTTAFLLAGDQNYPVSDTSGTCEMRIDAQTEIPGLICVIDTFTLVAIKGQYASDTNQPFQGYQLMPRFRSDFSRTANSSVPLRTIAEVQAPGADGVTPRLLDSLVRVRGWVSGPSVAFTSGTTKSLYVQDSTQGINVYGGSASTADAPYLDSVGVEFEIVGKVSEYNGLTELTDGALWVTDTARRDMSELVRLLPFNASLTENMESRLLTVVGDVVQEPYHSGSGYNVTIKNGSAAIALRINDAAGVGVSWMSKGRRIRVLGIVGQYDSDAPYTSGYQLMPRFNSDVRDTSGAFAPAAQLELDTIAPNPFAPALGQVASVQLNSPTGYRVSVAIFDLEGRTVKELLSNGPGGYYDLKWDGSDNLGRPKPAGIYLVNIKAARGDGETETISRPVVLAVKLN